MRALVRLSITIALALAMFAPSPAAAALKCSAKISGKDGTISVSGSGVTGDVRWGVAASAEGNAFANAATCVTGGKLKNCLLGALGSAASVTPPELCTVWVRDAAAECSAYLKGCTPGARSVAGPTLDPRFGSNTSLAVDGLGIQCVLGSVWLTAGVVGGATPAAGQILSIAAYPGLFQLIGNLYGGNVSQSTFALPDLRGAAPNGLTYVICTAGTFPIPAPN